MQLPLLVLLATGAIGYLVPSGSVDGVYSVYISSTGEEVHTLLNATTATWPSSSSSLSTRNPPRIPHSARSIRKREGVACGTDHLNQGEYECGKWRSGRAMWGWGICRSGIGILFDKWQRGGIFL